MTNEIFRSHVTQVGFHLTLAKTHMAALVYIDLAIKHRQSFHGERLTAERAVRRAFSLFATGTGGLIERGLVVHHYNERAARAENKRGAVYRLDKHYTITRAGRLAIGLLKESGLYGEYADALLVNVAAA